MDKTPKGMRIHIGIYGRTNVGKSSFLNMIIGQDVAITSPVPGTTTDVVEKTMELLPIGPVLFYDTAGLDDTSILAEKRIKKARNVFERSDVFVLIVESGVWTAFEDSVIREAQERRMPVIIVGNKEDARPYGNDERAFLTGKAAQVITVASLARDKRDEYINRFKTALQAVITPDKLRTPTLVGDLVPPGGIVVLIVPIDLEAPKGRLILPQVQAIRDILDNDALSVVVKEREYAHALSLLKEKPHLVVCDSQVVLKMTADTPRDIPCTTFSILFARLKGDLIEAARGAAAIERLKSGDRVLIAEACSHHAIEDDIGRVKIPRWIRQYVGGAVTIDVVSGKDYPEDISGYTVVIHCGACMFNRQEMMSRIEKGKHVKVPITNYGVAIAALQGVVERVLTPFPSALAAYKASRNA